MKIRQEETKDYSEVFKLIENAFEQEEHSDHKEQFLVERLRKSEAFEVSTFVVTLFLSS